MKKAFASTAHTHTLTHLSNEMSYLESLLKNHRCVFAIVTHIHTLRLAFLMPSISNDVSILAHSPRHFNIDSNRFWIVSAPIHTRIHSRICANCNINRQAGSHWQSGNRNRISCLCTRTDTINGIMCTYWKCDESARTTSKKSWNERRRRQCRVTPYRMQSMVLPTEFVHIMTNILAKMAHPSLDVRRRSSTSLSLCSGAVASTTRPRQCVAAQNEPK